MSAASWKGWKGRSEMAIRQWQILVRLRRGPASVYTLAHELGVCWRTVHRDLIALQAVPFPLTQDREHGFAIWALGSMPEWPRNQATPIAEIRRAS